MYFYGDGACTGMQTDDPRPCCGVWNKQRVVRLIGARRHPLEGWIGESALVFFLLTGMHYTYQHIFFSSIDQAIYVN